MALVLVGTGANFLPVRYLVRDGPEFKELKKFRKTRYLTPQEEIAVINAMLAHKGFPAYDKAYQLYLFLRDTGVRLSEALNAQWHDINLSESVMEVYRDKTDTLSLVPLTERLVEDLMSRQNQVAPFSQMTRAVRILRKTLDQTCNVNPRIVQTRGRATPHSIRDTSATNLHKNGMSLSELAKLLGHSHASMSQKYAHLEVGDMMNKARKIMN